MTLTDKALRKLLREAYAQDDLDVPWRNSDAISRLMEQSFVLADEVLQLRKEVRALKLVLAPLTRDDISKAMAQGRADIARDCGAR